MSEADDRAKRLTLLAVILGSAVVGVDATVTNVALPTISRELGGGLAGQQWVFNGYLLALGSLMLLGGSIGDLFGERRVFSVGVAGFGIGSLLCALAPSIGFLVGARVIQGLAGALLTPASLAVIVSVFSGAERGSAIGTWTAWGGIAFAIGPLFGGELLNLVSWRWIFAVNVPLVLLTLTLARRIPGRRPGARVPLDVVGAGLAALGLGGPVFALIEQPRLGWGSAAVLGPAIVGLVLLGGFLAWERRAPAPMLPLGLFSRRNFSAGNVETFVMYGGLSGLTFFLVLFLQQVAGFTPLSSGLAMLPVTLIMFLLSRRFGRLAEQYGYRLFMGFGPMIAAAGVLLLQRFGSHVSYLTDILPAMLLFGLGLSLTVAPLTAAVLADTPEGQAGIASAVNNSIARVAGLVASAAIGAIVSASFAASLESRVDLRSAPVRAAVRTAERQPLGVPQTASARAAGRAASVSAFHLGMGIVAGLLALGGLIGLVGIRDPGRRQLGRRRTLSAAFEGRGRRNPGVP